MKKVLILSLVFFTSILAHAAVNNEAKIIELGKAYKDFMYRNDPPKSYTRMLIKDASDELKTTSKFISETISPKSNVLNDKYLKLPDDAVLKSIYMVRQVSLNLRVDNPKDNNELVASLKTAQINHYELVDNYYSMLFTAVTNKLGIEKLEIMDFQMKRLGLNDDTEKGIFFLRCMNSCGSSIWGFMNIAKPRNTEAALKGIKKFPMFNGMKYFQYSDFYFTDFEIEIDGEPGLESYKHYFIDKYFETLLYHMICLREEGAETTEMNDLLLGSIMKNENLYKYTEHKDVLESIFKKNE